VTLALHTGEETYDIAYETKLAKEEAAKKD